MIKTQRSAALRTPSERLLELEQEINLLGIELDVKEAELSKLRGEAGRYKRFGGVSFGAVPMAQIWADLVLWESVLNENPELQGIIEIGTWQGGFSLWLDAQASARGIGFRTFDSIKPERDVPGFTRLDVFAEQTFMKDLIQSYEPVLLFCDGGNKPRELWTFPSFFKDPRSLVIVHDWGTEALPSDVPKTLEEVYGDFCDELGSISRVFRRAA